MVWVAREGGGPGDRDHEDIMMRRVPRSVGHRFRGAAGARGLTHAQYLAALVELHEAMRQRADQGDPEVAAALERLGLRTVSI
jgi:HPt (histidine-containing phosphotransfer) domain-containing protein